MGPFTETIIITLGTIAFTLTLLSPFLINRITKYKLEMERMRLEAEVKKEEIRVRNQFDMEKFLAEEQMKVRAEEHKQAVRAEAPKYNGDVVQQDTELFEEKAGRERVRY